VYSILIIEDDDDYRELLEFGLDNFGHQVKVVSRARQGLELIKKSNFDFVICDILMPEMDGLEFLLNLNQLNLNPNPKSIMISGGGMEHTNLYLDNSTLVGCDAVLGKPFKISQLDELIKATAKT
jgi:two-component system response regulator AtoC